MADGEALAQGLREAVDATPGLTGKKLSGGLGFLAAGNPYFGIVEDESRLWVGPTYEQCPGLSQAEDEFHGTCPRAHLRRNGGIRGR